MSVETDADHNLLSYDDRGTDDDRENRSRRPRSRLVAWMLCWGWTP